MDSSDFEAMDEMVAWLERIDTGPIPIRFADAVAGELTGNKEGDALIVSAWAMFVEQYVKLGTLNADLPVSQSSSIYGLTDHGREVIAAYRKHKADLLRSTS